LKKGYENEYDVDLHSSAQVSCCARSPELKVKFAAVDASQRQRAAARACSCARGRGTKAKGEGGMVGGVALGWRGGVLSNGKSALTAKDANWREMTFVAKRCASLQGDVLANASPVAKKRLDEI